MPEKDIAEKTLEAYNDVFADIVNGLLFHGASIIQEAALTDAQPYSMYKVDGKLHEQERDVAKYWNTTKSSGLNIRIAFLGVENQTKYERDMPIRVIGYDGAAYRAELMQGKRYPVVTLVLYFGDEPWGSSRSLYDAIDIPEICKPYVRRRGVHAAGRCYQHCPVLCILMVNVRFRQVYRICKLSLIARRHPNTSLPDLRASRITFLSGSLCSGTTLI